MTPAPCRRRSCRRTASRWSRLSEPSRPLQYLAGRVVVDGSLLDHAGEPAAAVGGPAHQPQRAVTDRAEQSLAIVEHVFQQVDRLTEHLVGALGDEAVRRRAEVLLETSRGV